MQTAPRFTRPLALCAITFCAGVFVSHTRAQGQDRPPRAAAEKPVTKPAPPANSKANESAAEPAATLRSARERLSGSGIRTVQAKLIERVSIGGRKFKAEGSYLQAPDFKIRLEFNVTIGSGKSQVESSLLEVCDGTILWTRHVVGGKPRITRRDVRQIFHAAKSSDPQTILTAELGLGGLPALLASLERSMVFTVQRDEEINGKKFLMIEGAWNPTYLDRFRKLSKSERLPDHIPDLVRIYLEPDGHFPRRIAFLKRSAKSEELKDMVELDLVDVVLNAQVDDSQFDFVPPDGTFPVDITNAYIQQLSAITPPTQTPPAAPTGGNSAGATTRGPAK